MCQSVGRLRWSLVGWRCNSAAPTPHAVPSSRGISEARIHRCRRTRPYYAARIITGRRATTLRLSPATSHLLLPASCEPLAALSTPSLGLSASSESPAGGASVGRSTLSTFFQNTDPCAAMTAKTLLLRRHPPTGSKNGEQRKESSRGGTRILQRSQKSLSQGTCCICCWLNLGGGPARVVCCCLLFLHTLLRVAASLCCYLIQ